MAEREPTLATPPVAIGELIAGKYRVERVLGEGGMGMVVAAEHRELGRRVAIKLLLPELAAVGMAAERFRREARAAANIKGEHVCQVMDVGTLESGVPYMVMEHLDGHDLATELERRRRLPHVEAVGYLLEACEAVRAAHAKGLIHRDLKPANLFLERRGDGSRRIKVLDFGVSKSLLDTHSGEAALTQTTSLIGSPLYMSPEQLDSAKTVDARSDIWSLGVVLYELLTGDTPFKGESIAQLVTSVLWSTLRAPGSLAADVPPGLDAVIMRALAKEREERFASVDELVRALLPFAPQQLASMPPPPPAADAPEASLSAARAGAGGPKLSRLAWLCVLLVLGAMAIAGYEWHATKPVEVPPTAAATDQTEGAHASESPALQAPPRPIDAPGSRAQADDLDHTSVSAASVPPATSAPAAPVAAAAANEQPLEVSPPPAPPPRTRAPTATRGASGLTNFGGRR